jgi:hypothetical protein
MTIAKTGIVFSFVAILLSFVHSAPVFAQSEGSSNDVVTAYSTSYAELSADITRPITVATENRLYYPGESVNVRGAVWSEVIEPVEALNVIKTEIKDGRGKVVAMSEAELDRENGDYSTSMRIPDQAGSGTYTVESSIELEADALGIVEAITSATLQSSLKIAVAEPRSHLVNINNQTFAVTYASNSALDGFEFKEQEKTVSIFAEGSTGTTGVLEISIPKALLSGEMAVFIDDNLASEEQVLLKTDTENLTIFEISYSHSIHQIEVTGTSVTPEFPFAALAAAVAIGSALLLLSRTRLADLLQRS